jgi:ubiquinone/menaquinone biosynthesis C-methylase UbiE
MEDKIRREIEFGKQLARKRGSEVAASFYSGSADYWTTPGGRIRFERRLKMLTPYLDRTCECLELGCGIGTWSTPIAKQVRSLISIDVSDDLVAMAQAKPDRPENLNFKVMDAHHTDFPDEHFDRVFCNSALHHLDIDRTLPEIHRVLRPGGLLIATEPNWLNPQVALERSSPWTRKLFGSSPDEVAFFRWRLSKLMKRWFETVEVRNFDFFHPALGLIPGGRHLQNVVLWLERVPVIREFSGSLFIIGRKKK